MSYARVSFRYAKSLLDLAVEQKNLEEVYKDMLLIAETVEESRDLQLLLKSPVIKTDKKEAVLSEVFSKSVSKLTFMFVQILLRKKRESVLGQVAKSFVEQYKVQKGITTAYITSAVQLDAATQKKVQELVAKSYQGEIQMVSKVDPEIIGGIIVRVGDAQIDSSIARKIAELKQEFSKNPYIPEF